MLISDMRCMFCEKKTSVLLECKYCEKEHCVKCRLQEKHKCARMRQCIEEHRRKLKENIERSGLKNIKCNSI